MITARPEAAVVGEDLDVRKLLEADGDAFFLDVGGFPGVSGGVAACSEPLSLGADTTGRNFDGDTLKEPMCSFVPMCLNTRGGQTTWTNSTVFPS
ncbi:hypothetical protein ACFYXC_20490 [Streptomyces sp. NPDC002701]|uniref:hypothetical protein n=1 Tax=Streptomyces sp. NPDC002701 TaxID=3364661 RepID=UPI00369E8EAC